MPPVWNKDKRLSVHITPKRRAEQLPTELTVKNGLLYCRWCEKSISSLRLDNIRLHLTSIIHKENKLKMGAPLTSDNMKRRFSPHIPAKTKRTTPDVYGYTSNDDESSDDESSNDESSDDDNDEEEPSEELSQLFEESDSDSTGSFEGFDDDSLSTDDEQSYREQSARVHNNSSDSIRQSKQRRKRKRSSLKDGSTIPIHSMPLKKQLSYKARTRSPPRKKGKLKIKICRQPHNAKSFQVESSDDEDASNKRKVASSRRSHDGLKMKFLLNKKNEMKPEKIRTASTNYSSEEEQRHDREPNKVASPEVQEDIDVEYDQEPNVFEGVEELIEDGVVADGVEVVEEEIVGIDEDEVVSWDAVVGEEEVVEEEVVESPETPIQPEPELTSEQSLTQKANYAREMARAVNSAQFKKKRLLAKKQAPKIEEKEKHKRKVSAYNLWSSRMRKQVADQYPGLQFGEVSKRLGKLWKKIPDNEKQMWKHRSDRMANKLVELETNTTKRIKGSRMIETGPKKKPVVAKPQPRPTPTAPFVPHKNPEQAMKRELQRLPNPSTDAMDAAAHFKLLGHSLVNMAKQVRSSRTSPYKSIPSLLDGLLCSLGPLLSLTNKIPQLQGSIPDACLVSTYCNNAHIMPGF